MKEESLYFPKGRRCDRCGKVVKRLYFYVWGMYSDDVFLFELRCKNCVKKRD